MQVESRPFIVGKPTKTPGRVALNLGGGRRQGRGKTRNPQRNHPPTASLQCSNAPCALSVYRRAPVSHRAFFEHFGFHPAKKILCFRLVSIPRRILPMKKMARLLIATLVLLSAVSISSFADGGAPTPLCSPGHCGGK